MSETDFLIVEQRGSSTDRIIYARQGRNKVVKLDTQNIIGRFYCFLTNFFREVLLPYGYPHSVSDDYFEYQVWDTAQAFCSTVTGAFTTRAILKSVGVGDAQATALSAAVTWILKDGTGMIGRIVFAWWKGNGLDSDCKKWRLFADILNDSAMAIELILPFYKKYSMPILCMTSTMKSIVGVAGGATRASITYHQAIRDNMAEISAKDGTQETLVNLVASVTSIYLLNLFNGTVTEWAFIVSLMGIHLLTNYLAVKALVFKNFNDQRLALVLKSYFTIGTVLSPQKINEKEDVFLGRGIKTKDFCGYDIVLGESLRETFKNWNVEDLQETLRLYEERNYLVLMDVKLKKIYISFEREESTETIILAYFYAVYLALATNIFNNVELDIYSKRQLHHVTPITRLYTFMKSYDKAIIYQKLPYNIMRDFEEFHQQESEMFKMALQINDWRLNSQCLKMGEWITDWKILLRKDL